MDHSTYKEMLSALLDDELQGAAREAALAHLNSCADCRAYFAELTALHANLGELEEFDAPEGFAAGVLARIRAENAPKTVKTRAPLRRYATLAACAAVLLLAVYALPNALRMGNSGASKISIQAAPTATSGASDSAPQAPAAPSDALE